MLRKDLIDDRALQLQALASERLDWLRENPQRALQHVLVFLALVAIYAVYLRRFIEMAGTNGSGLQDRWGVGAVMGFVAFAGWPLAAMALLSRSWSRHDAARTALAAYALSASVWLHRYGLHACVVGLAMLFLPLFVSAGIGHAAGLLGRRMVRTR